jgi:hypothetical protein
MLAPLGRPSGTIAVSTGMAAATTGHHGENPPPLHCYHGHGREAEAVACRPCPARIAGWHGRRRGPDPQELDVLSKTFLLMVSGPGRGANPGPLTYRTYIACVQRRSTSGGYCR